MHAVRDFATFPQTHPSAAGTLEVSVIIVSWNSQPLLRACLASLYAKPQNVRFETWVVDNDSHDGSAAMVRREFPHVHLIANPSNRGFASANNQALAAASERYLMLLNSDTEVLPNTLGALVGFLDGHSEAGGVGPRLLHPDGSVQQIGLYRKRPSLPQVCLFYTPLRRLAKKSRTLKGRYWEREDHAQVAEVDQPPCAALMVRREVIQQIGLLDERFFLYFEDADWCVRMRQAGWRLYFVPTAEVVHHAAGTTSQLGSLPRRYLFARSMVQFFRKHHGWVQATLVVAMVVIGAIFEYLLIALAFPLALFRSKKSRHEFHGFWAFLTGRWRRRLHPTPFRTQG